MKSGHSFISFLKLKQKEVEIAFTSCLLTYPACITIFSSYEYLNHWQNVSGHFVLRFF